MRAGILRHTIAFQTQTDVADGQGGFTVSWANVTGLGAVPAAIWPLRSTELIDAMKLESKVSHKIRIRYHSGITSKMRIYWADGSQTFNIIGTPINPDKRNIYLEIMATEDI